MTCEHETLGRRMAAEYAALASIRNGANIAGDSRTAMDMAQSMANVMRAMKRNEAQHIADCEGTE